MKRFEKKSFRLSFPLPDKAMWRLARRNARMPTIVSEWDWINIVDWWWRGLPQVKRGYIWIFEKLFMDTLFHVDSCSVRLATPDAAIAIVTWRKRAFVTPDGKHIPETTRLGVEGSCRMLHRPWTGSCDQALRAYLFHLCGSDRHYSCARSAGLAAREFLLLSTHKAIGSCGWRTDYSA